MVRNSTIALSILALFSLGGWTNAFELRRFKRQTNTSFEVQGQRQNPPEQRQLAQQQTNDVPANPACDFGSDEDLSTCQWSNINLAMEKWEDSKGENTYQLGGPPVDNTEGDTLGGYALYETSRVVPHQFSQSTTTESDSAMLMSPLLTKTKSIGNCIDFWYAMDGLSQDRLRILLRPPVPILALETNPIVNLSNADVLDRILRSDGRDDIVLWEAKDSTEGDWLNGQVVYAFNEKHVIIFEGLPLDTKNPSRAYRGYIAVDDIQFPDASQCQPFCTFEGGLCSWSQDTNDDFDWSLSRGSLNTLTGPPMDRFSFNYGTRGGGYAYIDSGFPRRPEDKARIVSETFPPPGPDGALCLRFWTHMFGNGIGALRVIIAPRGLPEEVIWELKSGQTNNWYQAQVTITAGANFQIVFEGEVGANHLGDIAIDEISIKDKPCPTSPQSATSFNGDCTFEVDECGWLNVDFRERLDEADWVRTPVSTSEIPFTDHTFKTDKVGHYMNLPKSNIQRGERSWFMSPLIEVAETPMCISFWYFMYDSFIEQTGPALGALRVLRIERSSSGISSVTPIWELKNHQGPSWSSGQARIEPGRNFLLAFEGIWGNSRGNEYISIDDVSFYKGDCSIKPMKAMKSTIDCDFTRDPCLYNNGSDSLNYEWVAASVSRRPSILNDHTYNGPVGYIYFDVFNTNNQNIPRLTLLSGTQTASEEGNPMCLTFWYAPIGSNADSRLEINLESPETDLKTTTSQTASQRIWTVTADQVFRNRIEWLFGQVQLPTESDFKISIVGQANKGGFALDDIKVLPGDCQSRPRDNELNRPSESNGNALRN